MSDPEERTWNSASYVQPRPEGEADAWTLESRGRGGQKLLMVGEVVPPVFIAEALEMPPGSAVVTRRRLILVDNQPVEIANSYFPLHVAAGSSLAEPTKIRGGAPTALAALGYTPAEVVEELTVRPASLEEATLLGANAAVMIVELVRVVRSPDGTPFEADVMVIRPEGRRFRYEFTASQ